MQTAGGSQIEYSNGDYASGATHNTLIYSAVAAGIVLGAAASAYWWRGRARALQLLEATPFERVEELIASCENQNRGHRAHNRRFKEIEKLTPVAD